MSIGRKVCCVVPIAAILALALCAAFLFTPVATAENPAPVLLSSQSLFAVSSTHVAYTSGNSLSIVDLSYSSDPFTLSNAFEGSATDIEITSDKIAVLSQTDEGKALTLFNYTAEGISEGYFPQTDVSFTSMLSSAAALTSDGDDLILISRTGARYIDASDKSVYYSVRNYDSALDMVFYDGAIGMWFEGGFGAGNMLFSDGQAVYEYNASDPIVAPYPDGTPLPAAAHGMICSGDTIYFSTENGIYSYAREDKVFSLMTGVSYASAIDVEGEYLYAIDKNAPAIKRYRIDGSRLEYNKCYDAEEYLAPTSFDLVLPLGAAEGDVVTLYRSPRDLEVVAQVQGGVIALTRVQYTDDVNVMEYYYCVTQAGEYGYVPVEDAVLTEPADAGYTAAQPLHGKAQTPVYAYPFDSSEIIATLSTNKSGAVIARHGEEEAGVLLSAAGILEAGGKSWCKVLIAEGERVYTGYMDSRLICPYVSYAPAGVHDFCKTDSGRAGVYVNLYSSPDETSQVVAQLPDDTELMLVFGYDENSLWTCVYYEDTAVYVLTEQITVSALTVVQITLIVVLCVLVALGVALGVVAYVKRKKKKDYNNEET